MKNIVICFDGTWNNADAEYPTNVVKMSQLVLAKDADGMAQVVFYDEGVGAARVAFAQTINSFLGGAFGVGLMDNIERAYRFLTFNYTPGDRIFVFGFSRGAFSARSFTGLMRTCGIPRKHEIGRVREAIALYQSRDREKGADAPPCIAFRQKYSIAGHSDGPQPLAVEYIGIWDTVGALGVPAHFLLANVFNSKYQFHDLALSSMVKSARHAVAIDEKRRTFTPALWANMNALNTAGGATPDAPGRPYQQLWFPGDHASVGGGGDVNGLWQSSLVWVAEGAKLRGLAVDETALQQYRDDIDFRASVYCMKAHTFSWASLSLRRWRDGPRADELANVSDLALQRAKAPAADLFERRLYRPRPLRAVVKKHENALGTRWR